MFLMCWSLSCPDLAEMQRTSEFFATHAGFGVNLICVEDGIDSSKDAGKLMISVLSAVAEIEREKYPHTDNGRT